MKKLEFEKKAYLKPEILAIVAMEGEMMQQLSSWGKGDDSKDDPEGGVLPDLDEDDDWGGK